MVEFKTIHATPIHARFGAEIAGVDLASPSKAQVVEIQKAWAAYSVLLFRDQ